MSTTTTGSGSTKEKKGKEQPGSFSHLLKEYEARKKLEELLKNENTHHADPWYKKVPEFLFWALGVGLAVLALYEMIWPEDQLLNRILNSLSLTLTKVVIWLFFIFVIVTAFAYWWKHLKKTLGFGGGDHGHGAGHGAKGH